MTGEEELVEVALELGEGACGVESVSLIDLLKRVGLGSLLGELIGDVEIALLDPLVLCPGGVVCCSFSLCVPITSQMPNSHYHQSQPRQPKSSPSPSTHQYQIPA